MLAVTPLGFSDLVNAYASHTRIGTLLYARPTEQDLQIRGEPLWLETKHIQYTKAHTSTPV